MTSSRESASQSDDDNKRFAVNSCSAKWRSRRKGAESTQFAVSTGCKNVLLLRQASSGNH